MLIGHDKNNVLAFSGLACLVMTIPSEILNRVQEIVTSICPDR